MYSIESQRYSVWYTHSRHRSLNAVYREWAKIHRTKGPQKLDLWRVINTTTKQVLPWNYVFMVGAGLGIPQTD